MSYKNISEKFEFIQTMKAEMLRGTRGYVGKYGTVKAVSERHIKEVIRTTRLWVGYFQDSDPFLLTSDAKKYVIDMVEKAILKHIDYLVYKQSEIKAVTVDNLHTVFKSLINNDQHLKWFWLLKKCGRESATFEDEYLGYYDTVSYREYIFNGYHIVFHEHIDTKNDYCETEGIIVVKTNSKTSVVQSMDKYGIDIYSEYHERNKIILNI